MLGPKRIAVIGKAVRQAAGEVQELIGWLPQDHSGVGGNHPAVESCHQGTTTRSIGNRGWRLPGRFRNREPLGIGHSSQINEVHNTLTRSGQRDRCM